MGFLREEDPGGEGRSETYLSHMESFLLGTLSSDRLLNLLSGFPPSCIPQMLLSEEVSCISNPPYNSCALHCLVSKGISFLCYIFCLLTFILTTLRKTKNILPPVFSKYN